LRRQPLAALHAHGEFGIVGLERRDPVVELREQQMAHAQHCLAQATEVRVLLLHRVLTDVVFAHYHDPACADQPKRPVM
jgi:hypothetical protein